MSKQQNSMKMIWLQSVNTLNVLLLGRTETDAMDKHLWLAWVLSSWGGGGPVGLWSNFWCCCIWGFVLFPNIQVAPLSFWRWQKRTWTSRCGPTKGGGAISEEKSIQWQCLLQRQPSTTHSSQGTDRKKKKEVSKSSWADIYCQINNRFQWFAS